MPKYDIESAAPRIEPTEEERALIRGMNYQGSIGWGHANIAALHFDGDVLIALMASRYGLASGNDRR